MNIWTVLKRFSDDKLSDRCEFLSSLKDKCISEKDYLHAIAVWIMLKMITVGDLRWSLYGSSGIYGSYIYGIYMFFIIFVCNII